MRVHDTTSAGRTHWKEWEPDPGRLLPTQFRPSSGGVESQIVF